MKFLPFTTIRRLVTGLAEPLCARGGDFWLRGSFVRSLDGFQPGSLNPIPISSDEF